MKKKEALHARWLCMKMLEMRPDRIGSSVMDVLDEDACLWFR